MRAHTISFCNIGTIERERAGGREGVGRDQDRYTKRYDVCLCVCVCLCVMLVCVCVDVGVSPMPS